MKKIKLVSDTISKNDIAHLIEWLRIEPTPQLTKGPLTIDFQNKWSLLFGDNAKSCFINSGSSAIFLALLSLIQTRGIKKVVVPAVSWATDLSSPMILGLESILCDCNLNDLSLDLDQLEEIFQKDSPDACILVSVLGLVPDMERITNLCKKYNVILIEDACESLGSTYNGRLLGTFGELSLFSFFYGHHISTIEGGMITTTNIDLWNNLVSIRNHGWDRDWDPAVKIAKMEENSISDFNSMYTFYTPGMNMRSTDLQAFFGLRQLEKIEPFSNRRFNNFKTYLKNIEETNLSITIRENDRISNFAFPVIHSQREKVIEKLKDAGVEVRPLIAGSMAKQPFSRHLQINYPLNKSEMLHEFGFYVPNHQDLEYDEILEICKIINSERSNF